MVRSIRVIMHLNIFFYVLSLEQGGQGRPVLIQDQRVNEWCTCRHGTGCLLLSFLWSFESRSVSQHMHSCIYQFQNQTILKSAWWKPFLDVPRKYHKFRPFHSKYFAQMKGNLYECHNIWNKPKLPIFMLTKTMNLELFH